MQLVRRVYTEEELQKILGVIQKNIKFLRMIPRSQKHLLDFIEKKRLEPFLLTNGDFKGAQSILEQALVITENELFRLRREDVSLERRLHFSAESRHELTMIAEPVEV